MKTLIYFTNLVSICMNTWINTLFYIRLFLVCVISSLIWISSLILCTTSLYALAGPKIGQIKSCILYLVSCKDGTLVYSLVRKTGDDVLASNV